MFSTELCDNMSVWLTLEVLWNWDVLRMEKLIRVFFFVLIKQKKMWKSFILPCVCMGHESEGPDLQGSFVLVIFHDFYVTQIPVYDTFAKRWEIKIGLACMMPCDSK